MSRTLTGREARREARFAGAWYLGAFVAGLPALLAAPGSVVANLLPTACYLGVTYYFYRLFRPVSPALSTLAVVVSLAGCAQSVLTQFHVDPLSLSMFGVYCLLVGVMIFRSGYLPRALGVAMAIDGVAWLTFASPALGRQLAPWNLVPGLLAEGALTVWLLVKGVDTVRWEERTGDL